MKFYGENVKFWSSVLIQKLGHRLSLDFGNFLNEVLVLVLKKSSLHFWYRYVDSDVIWTFLPMLAALAAIL